MAVALNHTIVLCRDQEVSAGYLTEMLGLPEAVRFGPFLVVEMDNGVSLDFHNLGAPDQAVVSQHYAFLVSEADFDDIYGRIVDRGQEHWADPFKSQAGINHNDGGRGTYFEDPDGHLLEIITKPYGG